ncbi:BES1/BZR1-like [Heracleum sosnowskyi]|uniref:Protein BZR1 homolog n=1 Tax=Heracleum sosnowskyi TaxID=360622 RepID=A0AAD8MJD1_9APIA|nr:BES1/BZR1-like [Heracleum sosnowskyi]
MGRREDCKDRRIQARGTCGGSAPVSPCSFYNLSPCASYNPSPGSSSFPSPASSSYPSNANVDGNSLIPWLKNLSSSSSSASSSKIQHQHMQSGSISAPVTSPMNSPARTPRFRTQSGWNAPHYSAVPFSTPPSPDYHIFPNPDNWFKGLRIPQSGPCSPKPCVSKSIWLHGGGSSRRWFLHVDSWTEWDVLSSFGSKYRPEC